MLSHSVYNVVHVFSVFLLFVALGGLFLHAINGGTKESNQGRKLVVISHGVAMVLILVAGFGMLAKLGAGFPGWAIAKFVLWVLLGAAVAIPYRRPELARPLWLLAPVLGGAAAWLAIYKPF